jgi:hypothetical protein
MFIQRIEICWNAAIESINIRTITYESGIQEILKEVNKGIFLYNIMILKL